MNKKTRNGILYLTRGAMIAACYVVLTYLSNLFGLANGAIQFRISEALCILPIFLPEAVPGLFVGCLISNLITAFNVFDVIFGSLATLIGAVITRALRVLPERIKWLATLPPVISNAVIVPFVLIYAYGVPDGYFYLLLTVAVGELVCATGLGTALYYTFKKYVKQNTRAYCSGFLIWGEIWDSNPRPPGPQPGAITSLANPTINGVP